MDFYLNTDNVVNRLVSEWEKHGKLIIAYDFDNTVFDYHNEGHKYDDVVNLLKECKEFGAYLVVFTAKANEDFPEMISYLKENDIPFDAINQNLDFVPFTGGKIYYNILLDDRAGLASAFTDLRSALLKMKNNELMKKWTINWVNYIEKNKLKLILEDKITYDFLKELKVHEVQVYHEIFPSRYALLFLKEEQNIYLLRKLLKLDTIKQEQVSCYDVICKKHNELICSAEEGTPLFEVLDAFQWEELVKVHD